MENPAHWTDVERVIDEAIARYYLDEVYGPSLTRAIAQALRDRGMTVDPDPPWTAFQPAVVPPEDGYVLRPTETLWLNSRYQVLMRELGADESAGARGVHLSVKRVDKQPLHDWRDLQRIKNELLGPEWEAVELYPAESRLVDNANQYHLWAVEGFRWPLGFPGRMVSEGSYRGSVQRPWSPGEKPADCLSEDEAARRIDEWRRRGMPDE